MRRIATALVLAVLATAGTAAAQGDSVTTCVARGAGYAPFRLAAGDTAAFQDSVRRAEPTPRAGYAADQPWFTTHEPINFRGYRLTKYGVPRFIEPGLLRRIGEHDGVGVYADARAWRSVDVFYLPVRSGCEFQPYQPAHRGIACSSVGCPWPRQEQPPGTVCRLRGDELVWAREDEEAGPPVQLATSRRWYAADRPITFRERSFAKMGLPRQLPPGSVRRVGEIDGVGVYVGAGDTAEHVFAFYVPVRAGCEFQLYDGASNVYGCAATDGRAPLAPRIGGVIPRKPGAVPEALTHRPASTIRSPSTRRGIGRMEEGRWSFSGRTRGGGG